MLDVRVVIMSLKANMGCVNNSNRTATRIPYNVQPQVVIYTGPGVNSVLF